MGNFKNEAIGLLFLWMWMNVRGFTPMMHQVRDSQLLRMGESAAVEWSKNQKKEFVEDESRKKKYVVVGGGWGGWGAAKALCQSDVNCDVFLIDALPDPTGATPYLSSTGKPVEAGTRGTYKQTNKS